MSEFSREVPISAVVAVTPSFGIGKNGTLPWKVSGISLHGDMRYFKEVTSRTDNPNKINAVVMGRRTWEGIPVQFRPLNNRLNIVVSRNTSPFLPAGVLLAESLDVALNLAYSNENIERVVIIGGISLFEEAIFHPNCDLYHVTYIDKDFDSDTFLSANTINRLKDLQPLSETDNFQENGIIYRMTVYDPRQVIHIPNNGSEGP